MSGHGFQALWKWGVWHGVFIIPQNMYHIHQSFGYSIVDACNIWYSLYVFPFRQCAGFIGRRTRLHLTKKTATVGLEATKGIPAMDPNEA